MQFCVNLPFCISFQVLLLETKWINFTAKQIRNLMQVKVLTSTTFLAISFGWNSKWNLFTPKLGRWNQKLFSILVKKCQNTQTNFKNIVLCTDIHFMFYYWFKTSTLLFYLRKNNKNLFICRFIQMLFKSYLTS